MSAPLRNVAITGASGVIGSVILAKLVASPEFNVRVLRRNGSSSTFAPGTVVVDVDFDSIDSLTAALKGQDAVVAPLNALAAGLQPKLFEASIKAGVKRFIPSEFGSDLDNPIARGIPVFQPKIDIRNLIEEKAKTTPITYSYVINGPFLDWGLEKDFLIGLCSGKAVVYCGGDTIFSSTTLDSIAQAVVGILNHPEETKNRSVFVEDIKTSQNKLLALAKQAAPNKAIEVEQGDLDAAVKRSAELLAQGHQGPETYIPYIYRSFLDPTSGCNFAKTDNALLGIKGKTEKDVIDIMKAILN